jgi:transposase
MRTTRKSYPSDGSDAEWELLLPYLVLIREDAPQGAYSLRELLNTVAYVVTTGCQWRLLPPDFPPWTAVYNHTTPPALVRRFRANHA